eukprot:TRINITY_DN8619_c0_g1_i1.p1 TRINITY_DN8619_c0_g1~~TRINITY_DN8619_c0_g1_i1.p1  ORF type:complete len:638 (-),score=100.18 TRINITY_DN8619_c0_g1_i1:47-1894(-)
MFGGDTESLGSGPYVPVSVASEGEMTSNELKTSNNLGKKTIGLWSGCILNVNNLVGPGVLAIPYMYQTAGWLPTTAIMIATAIIASFAATYLAQAMTMVPGNFQYDKRKEYCTLVQYYFGHRYYMISQVFFNVTLTTMNIPQIIVTAQVMDQLFITIFNKSYALCFYPFGIIDAVASKQVPFYGEGWLILSLGYIVSLILCMPPGFLNLDDNIWFQYVSFGVLFGGLGGYFVYWGFALPLDFDAVPMIGTDFTQVLGVVFFSFIFVVTVPSWLNEKRDEVSVNKGVWYSTVFATIAYTVTGMLGGWAYPDIESQTSSGDILSVMSLPTQPWELNISTSIFSFAVVGLGIPLYSIVIRYNLYVGKVCNSFWSAMWGVVFPWAVSWLFYQGSGLVTFVTYSATYISGVINFVIPFLLYLRARKMAKKADRVYGRVRHGQRHKPGPPTSLQEQKQYGAHSQSMPNIPIGADVREEQYDPHFGVLQEQRLQEARFRADSMSPGDDERLAASNALSLSQQAQDIETAALLGEHHAVPELEDIPAVFHEGAVNLRPEWMPFPRRGMAYSLIAIVSLMIFMAGCLQLYQAITSFGGDGCSGSGSDASGSGCSGSSGSTGADL